MKELDISAKQLTIKLKRFQKKDHQKSQELKNYKDVLKNIKKKNLLHKPNKVSYNIMIEQNIFRSAIKKSFIFDDIEILITYLKKIKTYLKCSQKAGFLKLIVIFASHGTL